MDDLDELLNATMAALDSFGLNRAAETVARASTEIERLRAEVASLTAQLQSGESFHAVAVHQRDAAWGEVETLKATLTQQCKGYRADVEKLETEIEALRPFVDRYVWLRDKEGALWAYGDSPASIDHQIDNDRSEDAAIDAARAAQGVV
jgi:chromosome segregation ATPase